MTLQDGGAVVIDTRADGNEEPLSHVMDDAGLPCAALELALKKMKTGKWLFNGHS